MTGYRGQPAMPEADVVIVPTFPEWDEHADDYLALSEAIDVELDLGAVALDRGVPHAGSDLPDFVPLGFLIYLGVKIADTALDALVDRITRIVIERAKTRWWTKGKQVEGRIYGPDGEILRRLTWESTDGERKWIDHR